MGNYSGFKNVKLTRPQKSTFDLTHDKRLTAAMGKLIPVLCTECVPSDSFNGSSEMLVRLAPLLAPIYDQIRVYVHYFFVPNRLIWDEWEDFITAGRLGEFSTGGPTPPAIDIGGTLAVNPTRLGKSSLADYLGVPVLPIAPDTADDYDGLTLDTMPFIAYQLIWYDYYRDRNFVQDTILEFPQSGAVPTSDDYLVLRVRNYEHDYFTSALPFTQRGAEVLIPLDGVPTYFAQSAVLDATTGTPYTNNDLVLSTQNVPEWSSGSLSVQNAPNVEGSAVRIENIESFANATTTINDFRAAYALQVWLERNAIGGSRYTESTQAHFGVRPQDSRLQRPEYIGGGVIPVKISEVVSTAYATNSTDDSVPQANMAGHGITYGNTNQFKYFCTEHGFILGILSIMSPPSYHQGLPRMFRRSSFLDYPWPTFAKLGEQQVNASEIFASAANLTVDIDDGSVPLFGYQSRYADWKYMCNSNQGEFHDTLLFWTLTRNFADSPVLGEVFNLYDVTQSNRIFAVSSETDNFWIYCHNKVFVKRPLPYFGTPNTLGFV